MKVTGVKTYVVENEPGERSGGGDPTIRWYVGGKFFLIFCSTKKFQDSQYIMSRIVWKFANISLNLSKDI